jgi:EAL and modified HD-GYP domain-containing signal transduction protein
MSVIAYELLFRTVGTGARGPGARGPGAGGVDGGGAQGDLLTAAVLLGSVTIGLDRLVGNKKLFCNASRGVLTGAVPILLPPERTVVEVLESVVPDAEVLAGCRRLLDQGFTLALDDFSWFPGADAFLELASIVKIDLRLTPMDDMPDLMERCRDFDALLLAEKVETTDELEQCEELGFDYFQGYLLSRPCVVPGRALDAGRLSQLRMAAHLLESECSISELEETVRNDPSMTHQLLQLAGMGAAGEMRRAVHSIRQALIFAGWRRIQSWVALLLITGNGRVHEEGVATALMRAYMCEQLASYADPALAGMAFTAGMISCFGVLFGVPLDTVLDSLPLDDDLRVAVLGGDTPLGRLLADASDFLLGRPEDATRSGLGEAVLSLSAQKALTSAVEVTSLLD